MSEDAVAIDGNGMDKNTSTEGKAKVFLPTSVFYNPVQEFNRDLTISVITQYAKEHFKKQRKKETQKTEEKTEEKDNVVIQINEEENLGINPGERYEEGIRILEGLAASGLRSVRFALEVPGVKEIVTNDFSETAVEFIRKNSSHNNVEHLITPSLNDAAMLMYNNRQPSDRFDVIDLDPYGSPALFLDSAVQAVKDGGILCITCTDMAILCGNHPETCYAKYGSVSFRSKFCHEMALRIVLHSIESTANRYSRYIHPLLSVSVDFYVRVFVRVFTGANIVKQSLSKFSMIYNCVGCNAFSLQPMGVKNPTKGGNFTVTPARGPTVGEKCTHCGFAFRLGGPIWTEAIHDVSFIDQVIHSVQRNTDKFGTSDRIIGMLSVVKEEIPNVPLYYITDDMASKLHCTTLNQLQWRSALLNAGYEVSLSHAAKNSLKTNAPVRILWDILRCWIKKNPIKPEHLKHGSVVKAILETEPEFEPNFEPHPMANPKSKQMGLLRWQMNPDKYWGPAARACKGNKISLEERRKKGTEKANLKRKAKHVDLKMYPCKKLKEGLCDYGEDCKYSHDIDSTTNESKNDEKLDNNKTVD